MDKPKVKIDLSEWGMGDWGERLEGAIRDGAKQKIREISSVITAVFDGDFFDTEFFDEVARTIIKEGIEEFLSGANAMADLVAEGVRIQTADGTHEPFLIPWNNADVMAAFPERMLFKFFELLVEQSDHHGLPAPTPGMTFDDWQKLRRGVD